jgi:uncharacterized membrane protein YeaQ/YmgE (transglycosylase-associated protein family)
VARRTPEMDGSAGMDIIIFVLTGFGVSAVARLLAGKKSSGRRFASLIAGILGALLGGHLGRMVGFHGGETQLAGYVFSVAGAILLVASYQALARLRASV